MQVSPSASSTRDLGTRLGRELVGFFGAIKYLYIGGDREREGRSISIPPASVREFDIREVKHDVYGKRQK